MIAVIILIISYLIGSIPMAFVMGKIWLKIDIRKYGSGNVGATNAFRVMGPKIGTVVLIADILKGVIAVLLAGTAGGSYLIVLAGLIVILGHTFSIFLGFKGGKGVATGAGTFVAIAPQVIFWSALIFVLMIVITKYVSVGSIAGAASLPILLIISGQPWQFVIYGLLAAAFVIYKHRANIERLRNGVEPKISERFR